MKTILILAIFISSLSLSLAQNCTAVQWYDTVAKTCKACSDLNANCVGCKESSTAGTGICTACGAGFFVSTETGKEGNCVACSANCKNCTESETTAGTAGPCTVCDNKYGLKTDKTCVACTDTTNCMTCNGDAPAECTQCNNGWGVKTDKTCQECTAASACAACNGDDAAVCSSCATDNFLNGDKVCKACDTSCGTCTNATQCTVCKQGYGYWTRAKLCSQCTDADLQGAVYNAQGVLEHTLCGEAITAPANKNATVAVNGDDLVLTLNNPCTFNEAVVENVTVLYRINYETGNAPSSNDFQEQTWSGLKGEDGATDNLLRRAFVDVEKKVREEPWAIWGQPFGVAKANANNFTLDGLQGGFTLYYQCRTAYGFRSAVQKLTVAQAVAKSTQSFLVRLELSDKLTNVEEANATCALLNALGLSDKRLKLGTTNGKTCSELKNATANNSRILQTAVPTTYYWTVSPYLMAPVDKTLNMSIRDNAAQAKSWVQGNLTRSGLTVSGNLESVDLPGNTNAPVFTANQPVLGKQADNLKINVTVSTVGPSRLFVGLGLSTLTVSAANLQNGTDSTGTALPAFQDVYVNGGQDVNVELTTTEGNSYTAWVQAAHVYDLQKVTTLNTTEISTSSAGSILAFGMGFLALLFVALWN